MEAKKKEHLRLEKNSGLFFVIGMTLVLALIYTALEWKTFDKEFGMYDPDINLPDGLEPEIPPLVVITPPPPPKIQVPEVIEIIKDDDPEIETIIEAVEPTQDTEVLPPTAIDYVDDDIIDEPIDFIRVEEVPVFPGCENSSDKRACFQKMIQKHIRRNFQYPENAIDMNLQGKVYLQFTVQKDGSVGELKMRSPHKILGDEAARIISKLPKMQPGKQRDKAVKVPFSIPITFQLQQ